MLPAACQSWVVADDEVVLNVPSPKFQSYERIVRPVAALKLIALTFVVALARIGVGDTEMVPADGVLPVPMITVCEAEALRLNESVTVSLTM